MPWVCLLPSLYLEPSFSHISWGLGIATKPLPPLFPHITSSSHLTDIVIVPHLTFEEPSSIDGSVIEKKLPIEKRGFKSWMYIVLNYLDFEDCMSRSCPWLLLFDLIISTDLSPKSDLMCFELKRGNTSPAESSKLVTWASLFISFCNHQHNLFGQSHRHLHTRSITNGAVAFLLPPRSSYSDTVIAGLLDTEGFTPKAYGGESKSRDIAIGKIVRLKMLVIRCISWSMY